MAPTLFRSPPGELELGCGCRCCGLGPAPQGQQWGLRYIFKRGMSAPGEPRADCVLALTGPRAMAAQRPGGHTQSVPALPDTSAPAPLPHYVLPQWVWI